MKFRKKPVVIEAEQFFPDREPWPAGVIRKYVTGSPYGRDDGMPDGWQVGTLEGPHIVSPGDWIIRGVKGELYPCKPDIFEMTYDRVEE
jgi:hypothetical protein